MRWAVVLALGVLMGAAAVRTGTPDEEAALLLKALNSWTNWQAALAEPDCGTAGVPWSAASAPCGTAGNASSLWRGVTCNDAGQITALQLFNCSMAGTLPAELAQLGSLETLDLSHNSLTGGVPDGWTAVGAFPKLGTLQLAFNNLTGALDDFTPAIQGCISSLVFNVSRNSFSQGTIPGQWYSKTLQLIDIAYNSINSQLPVDWGLPMANHESEYPSHFPSLARLAIEGNNITGPNDPWPGGGAAVFSPSFVCTGRPGNQYMEIVTKPPGSSTSSDGGGLSGGAIAGIAIGAVAAAAALALGAFMLVRSRRAKGAPAGAADAAGSKGTASRQGSDSEKGLGGGSLQDSAQEHGLGSGSMTPASYGSIPPSVFAGAASCTPSSSLLMDTDPSKLSSEWNIVEWRELEVSKTLGSGSFGTVLLAKFCHTPVAVKLLGGDKAPGATDSLHRRNVVRDLAKEVAIMSKLRSPNVCLYMVACLDPPCLIMEHCARQSLDTLLAQGLRDPQLARQLRWPRLLSFALGAARGMAYLHSRQPPVYHRDLKAANLLVTSTWQVKVCDFNLSKLVVDEGDFMSTQCIQNPRWLAPEVLGGQAGGLPAE
ncbi:hypothetical protein ABPG75_002529 [Micractinium tetrahymenae]